MSCERKMSLINTRCVLHMDVCRYKVCERCDYIETTTIIDK